MKAIRTLLLVSFAALMFVNTGCKKYEEGPMISLRSKKARVVNDWKVVKILKNGEEQDMDNLKLYYDFKDDNTGVVTHIVSTVVGDYTTTVDFKWEFNDDKTKIIFTFDNDDTEDVTILKLYEKEMWWEDKDGDDTYEYHLEPK